MGSSTNAAATFRTVRTKRDTRQFDGRAIPAEVMHRIVQAGRMAGSAKNGQPVRLVKSTAPNPKVTVPADLPLIESLLRQ